MESSLSSSMLGKSLSKYTNKPADVMCVFESEVFGGYSVAINTQVAQTLDEVLIFAVSSLLSVFDSNKLTKLLMLCSLRNFSIKRVDGSTSFDSSAQSFGVTSIVITDKLEKLT